MMPGLFNMGGPKPQQPAQPVAAPAQPAPAQPQAPMSLMDQMDQRHGKWGNRLGLLSHMLMGGKESEYGDQDLLAEQPDTRRHSRSWTARWACCRLISTC